MNNPNGTTRRIPANESPHCVQTAGYFEKNAKAETTGSPDGALPCISAA